MASPGGYPYPRSLNSICSLPVDVCPHSFNSRLRQESRNEYLGSPDRSFCDLTETLDEDSCEGDLGIPDMKLIEKIVSQVEFYLSDENLSRDAFLLKHVQKNKFGFVSIKLLTSFKKMKSLTRDWRQTLYALQFSDNLEVNEEETKVRRKTPVPNSLLGLPPTKLLLAWNLDCTDKTSLVKPQNFLETATSLFASFGILTSVRILKPGKEVPSDVKKYLARYPELATKNCALVEYENLEGARKALETFSVKQGATNGDNDVKVVPVSGRGTRKKSGMESDETENCDLPDKKLAKQHGKLPVKLQYTEDASCCSSSESDSTPASPILAPRFPCVMNFASPDISFNPSSFSSPRSSPLLARKCFSQPHHSLSPLATDHGNRVFSSSGTSPEKFWRHPEHSNDSGICSSSWVQRRKAAAHNLCLENKSVPCSPLALKKAVSHGLPSGILRLPHGPDGSRGFHNSISRGKLVLRH